MIIDGKEYEIRMNDKVYHCALDVTMDFIGGKWKAVVLWYLRKEAKRFSELKRHIPEITEKMLSMQLKQLESAGIITRKVFAEVPPRVEYSLTEVGKTLLPLLQEIASWGKYMGTKFGKVEEKKPGSKTKKQKSKSIS